MAAKPRAVRYSGTPMARPGGPPLTVPGAHPKPARHPKPMTPAQLRSLRAWERKHPFPKGPFRPRARPKRAAAGLVVAGDWWIAGRNDDEPSCVATAIANSLLAQTGVRATEEQVLKLHWQISGGGDGVSISDALASVMQSGLAGVRPADSWVAGVRLRGAIVGLTDGTRDHAVTFTPQGLISWGAPLDFDTAEGWFEDGEIWNIDWLGGGR